LIDLASFGAAVQNSGFGHWAGQSPLAYPVANVLHLLGLVMLVGGIGILDLRLAGMFRAIPIAPLSRALTHIAIGGFVLMVPTGAILFAADAESLVQSTILRWKLALIGLALANALAFRFVWARRIAGWDERPPPAARIMALASIGLWLGVAALGRWIAYS
jgi:hypothetical protein